MLSSEVKRVINASLNLSKASDVDAFTIEDFPLIEFAGAARETRVADDNVSIRVLKGIDSSHLLVRYSEDWRSHKNFGLVLRCLESLDDDLTFLLRQRMEGEPTRLLASDSDLTLLVTHGMVKKVGKERLASAMERLLTSVIVALKDEPNEDDQFAEIWTANVATLNESLKE
ncbi:MAG: uncharacterized protein KVP18_003368 [Porospora cf. gigantea A]|uniref:uncharacterized protein n=1 Tax=Porospora cf. gigantea A TaxID=2853593 RepID=UPI003559C9D1|nr:MAG: hypothetical protein KVP18_003368 [Porospora cf. gigantea A]